MIETIDANSIAENYPRTRLPKFTEDEIELIKGSADFLGLNYYLTAYCSAEFDNTDVPIPSLTNDIGADCARRTTPQESWGFRKLLKWIKTEYNNPEIIITENGLGTAEEADLDDCDRVNLYNVSRCNNRWNIFF